MSLLSKAAALIFEKSDDEVSNSPARGRSPLSSDDLPDLDLPPEARMNSRAQTQSIEEIVRDADGPNLEDIKINEAQISAATPGVPGGIVNGDVIDFAAIYRAANLPSAPFGAEQMLETLVALSDEVPLEMRRATVKAILSGLGKTMGATPETVVADASRKLAALNSFSQFMEKKTAASLTKSEAEIAALEAQIDAKKAAIQAAKTELSKVTSGCEAEADRLDDVLEFFSLDAGKSKPTAPAQPVSPSSLPTHK